jgi:hypothetical protein
MPMAAGWRRQACGLNPKAGVVVPKSAILWIIPERTSEPQKLCGPKMVHVFVCPHDSRAGNVPLGAIMR